MAVQRLLQSKFRPVENASTSNRYSNAGGAIDRDRPQATDTNAPCCSHNILHFFNGVVPTSESNQRVENTKTGGPGADIVGCAPTDIAGKTPTFHFAAVILKAGATDPRV